MERLNEILQKLEVDQRIIDLAFQKIELPSYIDDYGSINEYWYGYPPCLIPIFLGHGPYYIGINKHWFLEGRTSSFVDFSLEWGYLREIAHNAEQFLSRLLIDLNSVEEGITETFKTVCESLNFDPELINDFCEEYGNISEDYDKFDFFKDNIPMAYCNDLKQYKGNFPSSSKFLNTKLIQKSCLLEITQQNQLSEINDLPEWLNISIDKRKLFEKYLKANQLDKAWLTLNSSGLYIDDILYGLEQLKLKTENPLFHLIADNWIEGCKSSNIYKKGDKYML